MPSMIDDDWLTAQKQNSGLKNVIQRIKDKSNKNYHIIDPPELNI